MGGQGCGRRNSILEARRKWRNPVTDLHVPSVKEEGFEYVLRVSKLLWSRSHLAKFKDMKYVKMPLGLKRHLASTTTLETH